MPRFQPLISHFSWGELSPIMQGRVNLPQYKGSCQTLVNFQVDTHGGIRRRLGSRFVAETKYSGLESRLIPFIFSREDSYILEFGDYYIRFYRNGQQVINPGSVQFHLGDGTAVNFFYPFPAVTESDIEVYVEPNFTIPTDAIPHDTTTVPPAAVEAGKVRIEPLTTGQSYAPNFRDADWTYNDFSIGAGATDVVSDGVATKASLVLATQPVSKGALVDIVLDIVSTAYTPDTATGNDTANIPLVTDAPPVEIFSFTPAIGSHDNVTLSYQLQIEDASGNRTSNFDWTLRRNGQVIDSGTALAVTSQLASGSGIAVQNLTDTDEFTIEVQASGNHGQSLPQVSGTVAPTSISVDYDKGRGGNIYVTLASNSTSPQTFTRPADQLGTWQIIDQGSVSAREFNITIEVDPWLVTTLDNIGVTLAIDGYDVEFATDIIPAQGAIVYMRDGSQPVPEEAVTAQANAANEIFEIPTPYAAEHVKDIHFVQANDIMYLVHERYHPRTLTRYNVYDWRVEQPSFWDLPDVTPAPDPADYERPAWADPNYDPLQGYPRAVTFFQQRLVFAGTASEPQTVWGSRVADFVQFSIPLNNPAPDDPVRLVVAAQTQEEIQWLASSRSLFIGTTGNEHRVTVNSFLAVDNLPDVTRQSEYGSRHIQPQFIGTSVLFIQSAGREVRTYDLDRNANIEFYDSLNAAWLSEHITESGIVNTSYWRNPYSVLFCTRADGVAATMTYDPSVIDIEDDMLPVGWARQATDGFFEWFSNMPQQDCDQPWFIVRRVVNGQNKRYVEFMCPSNPVWMDSQLDYIGPESTTMLGLEHLEGKTVQVKVGGAVHPDRVVANGQIELEYAGTFVEVGLKYTSVMKTAKWDDANPSGSAQPATIRWAEIVARLDQSAIPLINGQQPAIRHPSTPMNTAESVITADVSVRNLGFDREGSVEIQTEKPYACHLLALFGQMGVYAG